MIGMGFISPWETEMKNKGQEAEESRGEQGKTEFSGVFW